MDDRILKAVGDAEAYVVGGAVRDRLLGRQVVDLDVACRQPERAASAFRREAGGAVFLLSERHGAWRVAFPDGRTVDFTLLRGRIDDDLAERDFTVNAIAIPLGGGQPVDPFGGRADLEARSIRAVGPGVFVSDPVRLLRAVRLEDELEFMIEQETEAAIRADAPRITEPAGERVLAELERLTARGYQRLAELGLLRPLGGSGGRLDHLPPSASSDLLLVAALDDAVFGLPVSNRTRRFARTLLTAVPPEDGSARSIHRFRRTTEPWALEALAFLGALEFRGSVEAARAADPPAPLLRGDELGLPPGPEIGRLLEVIEEERAAGTIATREEALALLARETGR